MASAITPWTASRQSRSSRFRAKPEWWHRNPMWRFRLWSLPELKDKTTHCGWVEIFPVLPKQKAEERASFSHPHLWACCNTWKDLTIRRLFGEKLWLQSSISRSPKVMGGWGKTPHWSQFTWQKSQPRVLCWNWRLVHVRAGVRATVRVTALVYHVQRHVTAWPAVTCVEIRMEFC